MRDFWISQITNLNLFVKLTLNFSGQKNGKMFGGKRKKIILNPEKDC